MTIVWWRVCFIVSVLRSSFADVNYPLVGFEDYPPKFPIGVKKTYTTQLGLIPLRAGVMFDQKAFFDSVAPYYSNENILDGYVDVSITEPVRESRNLTLVTYNVIYEYDQLMQTPGISDEWIRNTIGNYQHVIAGIQSGLQRFEVIKYKTDLINQHPMLDSMVAVIEDASEWNVFETGSASHITEDYYFPASSESFQFTGKSLCSDLVLACNATQVKCIETLDGVSVSCASLCKFKLCLNHGECKQKEPYMEPECLCPSKQATWYVGERCEAKVEQWMGNLLVVLACLLFVVMCCLSIAIAVLIRKKKYSKITAGDDGFFKSNKKKDTKNYSPNLYRKYKESANDLDNTNEPSPDFSQVNAESNSSKDSFSELSSDETPSRRQMQKPDQKLRYRVAHQHQRKKATKSRKLSNATKVYLMIQAQQAKAAKLPPATPKRRLSNAAKIEMVLQAKNMQLQQNSVSNVSKCKEDKTSTKIPGKRGQESSTPSKYSLFGEENESFEPSTSPAKWLPVQKNINAFDFEFEPTVYGNFEAEKTPSPLPQRLSAHESPQVTVVDLPIPNSYRKPVQNAHSNSVRSETKV